MTETLKSPENIVSTDSNESNTNSSWLDAQTELITRLESEYNVPTEITSDTEVVRHYGFSVGQLNLLITEDEPCEVLEENDFYSVPLAPKWLVGTCNVRGDIVPIIDIEHILNSSSDKTQPLDSKAFIIGKQENALGLLLSKLPMPIHFKKHDQINDYSELPEVVRTSVSIAYKRGQDIWACIDFANLLATLTNQQSI